MPVAPARARDNCPGLRGNPSYPERSQPFREFAIHYHDDFVGTQAFAPFRKHGDGNDDAMTYTLQGSRDFFAINYGMAGIGAEVWANRIKVGPMHDCATCRFEEFFLSSWAVGDPAMVVDIPANAVDPATNQIKIGPKATKALYPDDPSERLSQLHGRSREVSDPARRHQHQPRASPARAPVAAHARTTTRAATATAR